MANSATQTAAVTNLAENKKLRFEIENNAGTTIIRPVGTIDEEVNFAPVTDAIKKIGEAPIQFDLGQVNRINSCGVREWISFMNILAPLKINYSFMNVNELFVEQANMITNLFGKKKPKVLSFKAPYYCSKCQKDVSVLVRSEQILLEKDTIVAPENSCPTCKSKLEFDWPEEQYFSFLKHTER